MWSHRLLLFACAAQLHVACSDDLNLMLPTDEPDMTPTTAEIAVKLKGSGGGIISSDPYGISCGISCSYRFPVGQPVSIVASPDFQSSFVGFRGACSDMDCTVVPKSTDPIDVYAEFKQLACMPKSTRGCSVCADSISWIPGYGTASCSDAGVWNDCISSGPGRRYISQNDMRFDCGQKESDGIWRCRALTDKSIRMELPAKYLAPGEYDASTIYAYYAGYEWGTIVYTELAIYLNGSPIIRKSKDLFLYPRASSVVAYEDLHWSVRSYCTTLSATLTVAVSAKGKYDFLGLSDFLIIGK